MLAHFYRVYNIIIISEKHAKKQEAMPVPQKINILYMFNKLNILRAVLLAAAVVFILLGLLRNEAGVVFMRAIHICLSCIGLG